MTTTTITRLLKNTIGTAMLAGALLLAPQAAQARVFFSVGFAPPVIPIYAQPICPGDGYIWTPGYWAYTDDGYQWVDGAWVLAPYTGALWTPGYWGYGDSGYFWNAGYWGTTVGYYGGINYGFGYFGTGFYGGYWDRGAFFYNREYNHFGDRAFRNVYDQHVNGFDGRPGGSSFARGGYNENRGGGLNNGFVENGGRIANGSELRGSRNFNGGNTNGDGFHGTPVQVNNNLRIANGSHMRNVNTFNTGVANVNNGNRTNDNFAGNRGGYHQPIVVRPQSNFNGGGLNGNFRSNAQPAAPSNSFHPSQGNNNVRGNAGGNFHSAPAPSFHASAPAQSFHGNSGGGGGFHGGGRR